jgi:hypothetical protein
MARRDASGLPTTRYGLALESKHLSSTLAVPGSDGLASVNRIAASRLSFAHTW